MMELLYTGQKCLPLWPLDQNCKSVAGSPWFLPRTAMGCELWEGAISRRMAIFAAAFGQRSVRGTVPKVKCRRRRHDDAKWTGQQRLGGDASIQEPLVGKKISRWEWYKTLKITVNICKYELIAFKCRFLFKRSYLVSCKCLSLSMVLLSMAVELCWNQAVRTKLCSWEAGHLLLWEGPCKLHNLFKLVQFPSKLSFVLLYQLCAGVPPGTQLDFRN